MQSKFISVPTFLLMTCSLGWTQPARRLAIVPAHGAAGRPPAYVHADNQITDGLTAKLAGQSAFTLVDRASVDKILQEQNFQNSDRSSSDTAARIGKLLGVAQIVLVNVYDFNYSTNQVKSGSSTRTNGTITARVTAKMIDVETAVIVMEPASKFQETVLVSEVSTSRPLSFGTIQIPAKSKSSGGDPKVIEDNEIAKAIDAITGDLAAQLTASVTNLPKPKAESPVVAGIVNGSVYITGSMAGIAAGTKFQVTRQVSIGLDDPKTGKPIVQKQKVCVLTVATVGDDNASGSCEGGLPQRNDVAEPM